MFTPDQQDILQREFLKNRNPSKETIAAISKEIGVDEERVKNCFKNKRSSIVKAETKRMLLNNK